MCSPNDPSSELEQCKQELQSCKEELEYYKTKEELQSCKAELEYYKTKSEEYHGLLQVCREKYENAQKQPEAVSAPPEKSNVENASKKEKRVSFAGFIGGVKLVLMWLFSFSLYIVPTIILPVPSWVIAIYIFIYVMTWKDIAGFLCTIAYVWDLVILFQKPYLTYAHLLIIPCFIVQIVLYIIRYRQASKRF